MNVVNSLKFSEFLFSKNWKLVNLEAMQRCEGYTDILVDVIDEVGKFHSDVVVRVNDNGSFEVLD